MSRRLVKVAGPLIVVASFFLVNGRRLLANLDQEQWEDPLFFNHVRQNIHGLTDVFTHGSYWKGLYRPLSTNLFYLVGSAFNNDLRLYHLVLLATYLVNAGLFYSLAGELLPIGYATLAGVLFVTRAATVEVPLYTSQFQTLLPATFTLATLKIFGAGLRRGHHLGRLLWSMLTLLLALLSKESSITVCLVLVTYALLVKGWPEGEERRRFWLYCSLPVVVTAGWAVLFLGIVIPRVAGHQTWWTYVFSFQENARNLLCYFFSFSNLLTRPIVLHDPAIFLREFPVILRLSGSAVAQASLALSIVAGAMVLLLPRRFDAPEGGTIRSGGWAILWFAFSLLPVIFFKDRLLMYYGYQGTAALSLAAAGGARIAAGRLVRWLGHSQGCPLCRRPRAAGSL